MFGLMMKKSCGVQAAEREHYRLHYCGTCKSLGKQYSQSARMLLNYDCVFLAELLTALSKEDTAGWQACYHSCNCLASGGEGIELPLPLRYAAATNVLLSALKTDDNLKDSPALLWRFIMRWFNADFKKAENEMARFGVDMDEIWRWIQCQQQRERERNIPGEDEMALKYFSEPTARITAAVFSKGAALTGHDPGVLYHFGYQLGELIYVLDALEDEEKDKKKHNFNALQRIYNTIEATHRQSVAACLRALTLQIQDTIKHLPVAETLKEEYEQRLSGNISVRLENILAGKQSRLEYVKRNLRSRLASRALQARSFAGCMAKNKPAWMATPQYALSYLFVLMIPSLPQDLNPTAGHSDYTAPAFATLMAGFLSALVFRRRIRRFVYLYKNDIKRPYQTTQDGCCDYCFRACLEACFQFVCGIICSVVCTFLCSDLCNHGKPYECRISN